MIYEYYGASPFNVEDCYSYHEKGGINLVYVLLDHTKPGHYEFKDFYFDYEPFYVGMGKLERPRNSIKKALKHNVLHEKGNRIRYIYSKSNKPPVLIYCGSYPFRNHAQLVEAKLINIIGRKYLTNSVFPYLKIEHREILDFECPGLFHLNEHRKCSKILSDHFGSTISEFSDIMSESNLNLHWSLGHKDDDVFLSELKPLNLCDKIIKSILFLKHSFHELCEMGLVTYNYNYIKENKELLI